MQHNSPIAIPNNFVCEFTGGDSICFILNKIVSIQMNNTIYKVGKI